MVRRAPGSAIRSWRTACRPGIERARLFPRKRRAWTQGMRRRTVVSRRPGGSARSFFGWLRGHEWRNRIAAGKSFLQRFVLVVAFVAFAPLALVVRFLPGRLVLGVWDILAITSFHGDALLCGRPPEHVGRHVNARVANDRVQPSAAARHLHRRLTSRGLNYGSHRFGSLQ